MGYFSILYHISFSCRKHKFSTGDINLSATKIRRIQTMLDRCNDLGRVLVAGLLREHRRGEFDAIHGRAPIALAGAAASRLSRKAKVDPNVPVGYVLQLSTDRLAVSSSVQSELTATVWRARL